MTRSPILRRSAIDEPDEERKAIHAVMNAGKQTPSPDRHKEQDFTDFINEDSFKQITAQVEPSLVNLTPGTNVQFQRLGYFVTDTDSTLDNLIFNKTVGLRDTWAKKGSN